MAEYIDREALKNDIAKSTEPFNTGSVFRAIDRQIAADVAPVVHGRWVFGGDGCVICSRCNEEESNDNHRNYCPNCGAKMNNINEENNKGEVK